MIKNIGVNTELPIRIKEQWAYQETQHKRRSFRTRPLYSDSPIEVGLSEYSYPDHLPESERPASSQKPANGCRASTRTCRKPCSSSLILKNE
jgi:hypothetical protein